MLSKNSKKFRNRNKTGKNKEGSGLPKIPPLLAVQGGFPDRFHTTIGSSATNIKLVSTTQVSFGELFPLNYPSTSMLGYSQLSEVYNKFFVRKSTIKVMVSNYSASASRVNVCPVNESTSLSFPTATDDVFVENPRARNIVTSELTGGNSTKRLTNSCQVGKLLGMDFMANGDYENTGYTGGSNSTLSLIPPNTEYQWYLSAQTLDGTNLTTGIYCSVQIELQLEFFDRLPKY